MLGAPLKAPHRAIITGICFFGGAVLFGVFLTATGMTAAFHRAASSPQADPSQLAQGIRYSLLCTSLAVVLAVIGIVFVIVGVIRCRPPRDEEAGYREQP